MIYVSARTLHHPWLLLFVFCTLFATAFGAAQTIEAGDALFDQGDYAGAAGVYQRIFDETDDGVALYKLANAKVYAAGQTEGDTTEALYDAAVTAAKEAVELVPDDLEAHMALVRAWGRLAQYRGVLESLNIATLMKEEIDLILERDPNHDGALHALALWHLNVPWVFGGRSDKTRGLFEQAIAVNPTVLHHLEYGESLLTLGDPAAAKAQLEAALALPAPTAADRDEQAKAQAVLTSSF